MTVTIRAAVRADLADIIRLIRGLAEYERLAHEFTATEADIDALLFGPDRVAEAWLADIPGRAAAGIALCHRTVNTFKGRTGLFLEDLFVEPDLRGAGIGLALMRFLAKTAVARGCTVIEWHVLDWNGPAIQFYEQLGAPQVTRWQARELRGAALTALSQEEPPHG